MDGRQERLRNDYQEMIKLRDKSSGMFEFKVDKSYRHYEAVLHGIHTFIVNKDGGFKLVDDHVFTIDLPAEYPMAEPKFKFANPLYHPNWYGDGRVCLGILSSAWDPATKLNDLVEDTIKMMTFEIVNPNSPANGEACRWYNEKKDFIKATVSKEQFENPSGDTLEITEFESSSAEEGSLDITEM
ncbi:MAG TPA: ubiquitin-conjugating enzyme E2 [Methanothrix soehngenii]|nr:ubiquitin-conjugating enzyme E2 [Methanothrix soehngenii]HPS90659.1 ubiquitin-conjugating enzyme E2 [Methanothrix sp.]